VGRARSFIAQTQMRCKRLDRDRNNCERKWQTGKTPDRLPLKMQTWGFREPSLPVTAQQDELMAIQMGQVQLS
jgi:hypothetical protein